MKDKNMKKSNIILITSILIVSIIVGLYTAYELSKYLF